MTEKEQKRAEVLLKATLEILSKCNDSFFVKNVLEETAHYDGVDWDGLCLMSDIQCLFEEMQESKTHEDE